MKTKLTLFVAVLAFCFQQSLIGADLKKGLVAYYPFNGNAKDESGNGHDGHPEAGIKLAVDRHGQPYKAYKFSGSHRIGITKSKKLEFQEHTLSAWVNVLDYGFHNQLAETQLLAVGGGTLTVNFEARPAAIKAPSFGKTTGYAFASTNKGTFDKSGKGQNSWGGVRSLKDNDGHGVHHYLLFRHMFPYRQWVLLTGTYNGKEMKLYLNGQLEDSAAITAKLVGSTEHWRSHIGPNSTERFSFTGSIDDVRIYNRGLSAEEVKALYDLEKPKGK
jgi:hypothetical protein